jgi:hypothetical protein
MDNKHGNIIQRQLATLKLVSRLLGHEMHSQGGAKTVTLTREEVGEIQTTLDLFIENVSRNASSPQAGALTAATAETHLVSARN